jgi:hypothetical protein
LIDTAHAGGRVAIGQKPEIAAAADGHKPLGGKLSCGDWHFANSAGRGLVALRMPAKSGNAITIVMDRVDARVVSEAEFHKNL